MHDSDTRSRLGIRLDQQDRAIASVAETLERQNENTQARAADYRDLAEVVEGLLDEHENLAEWLPEALEAGFSKEPIPRMPSSVPKLRRKMPDR